MDKNKEYTLGKNNEFYWYISNDSIVIEKKFKSDKDYRKFIFNNNELQDIIKFIKEQEIVKLNNNVTRMRGVLDEKNVGDEYFVKGLGPFVYKYTGNIYKAQSTSQLVAIFAKCGILEYENKRPMKFRLKENFTKGFDELFII